MVIYRGEERKKKKYKQYKKGGPARTKNLKGGKDGKKS